MIEFTAAHFDRICRIGPVQERIENLETTRRAAVRLFWMRLIGGFALGLGSAYAAGGEYWPFVAAVFIMGGIYYALRPLKQAQLGLKHPVLEALAAEGGLDYLSEDFDPPVYPEARPHLFGRITSQDFSDMFWGTDPDGRRFAMYEAVLRRGSGKQTTTMFSGQIYSFQRRPGSAGTVVLLPSYGLLDKFQGVKGMERVRTESDREFDKKFAVHATNPLQAKQLLFDSALRRQLLELRKTGRVFAYLAPEDALVAVWGKDRFEPGSMFRARCGEERVRAMFEDVRSALDTMEALKARLG